MSTDSEAIEAIRKGDTERYGELVERYQRAVYAIAWSRLGDADLSEEAVQETFVQGFRYLGGLRNPEKFPAWITRIARRMASAIGRSRQRELARRERWDVDELASPEPHAASEGRTSETLGKALAALPDAHRESLVLFYLEGKSVREAAGLLGISEGAFKVRLHRARGRLREATEERLDRSLRGFSPKGNMRDRILAIVPAFPLGWGAKAGAFGYLAAVLLPILTTLPGLALSWYLYRRQAANFCQQDGYRQAMLRRSTVRGLILAMVMFTLSSLTLNTWGLQSFHTVFRWMMGILTVCSLPGIVKGARRLRVNNSRFSLALFIASCIILTAMAAFAFLGASFAWILLAGAVFWSVMWWALRHIPPRADYSLFLRAAFGGLGETQQGAKPQFALGRGEMRRFARFLGERLLAVDYTMFGNGERAECILYSPVLAGGLVRRLPAPLAGNSTILVRADGTCRAHVSDRDLREIQSLETGRQPDARDLEGRVSNVVGAALQLFLVGDAAGAEALLQAEPDEAIFKQPMGKLASQRAMFIYLIVASFLMFLLFLLGSGPGL